MVNVLSVDFDWIMEPTIELYNPKAEDSTNLNTTFPILRMVHLFGDYGKYKQLNIYLKNITNKITDKSHIKFCDKHEQILTCIKNDWKLDVPLHVYNIDHHHDCGYHGSLKETLDAGPMSNNWPLFNENIKKYTWINNANSETTSLYDDVLKHFGTFEQCSDINIINYIDFDYVFVCLSPGWVPEQLYPLYDALQFNIIG